MGILDWLKRANQKAQASNLRRSLRALIDAANALDRQFGTGAQPSEIDPARFRKARDSFAIDLAVGLLPVADAKRDIIDPALEAWDVTEGARTAVTHTLNYVVETLEGKKS